MNPWLIVLVLAAALGGCSTLDKDNEPKDAPTKHAGVEARREVYLPLVQRNLDGYGLVEFGPGKHGDSALFSCLARFAGAATFDPEILFTVEGKPIRHPEIRPNATPNAKGSRGTPISRDMVAGILYCLLDLHREGETAHALELVTKMIDFGKSNKLTIGTEIGWLFCSAEDRATWQITDEDWTGKCWMTPGVVKDIYRVAKLVGYECDDSCQAYMLLGPNIPSDNSGFQRHLSVIGTMRNGFVEGAINDNSLRIVLKNAAEEQPRNGLYVAAYHRFGDGAQDAAYAALDDEALFPREALPTAANYCTDYLFQRDDDSAGRPDGKTPDWKPCGDGSAGPEGRGVDWLFAACVALAECG